MDMEENTCARSCIDCGSAACNDLNHSDAFPPFCLSKNLEQEVLEEAVACYQEADNHAAMVAAAQVECEHYCQYTRVQEIVEFAKKLGFHKLGIATCVGHDSLFYKYSDALVTTLVAKDRVLGHNPAAALYNAESYYKSKLFGPETT
ncbi:DUF1847 domain-containing protein [uncultured Flavonifractor sp.]|uniref:DUF1847 domain-containing protein n=1 Tax=uncultured Flavonifractor sp. TaxID=1193534 RepID=UPI00263088B5|nr:DUF1847 domain-containing protein [uncultured Flavonifractor sp.]